MAQNEKAAAETRELLTRYAESGSAEKGTMEARLTELSAHKLIQ